MNVPARILEQPSCNNPHQKQATGCNGNDDDDDDDEHDDADGDEDDNNEKVFDGSVLDECGRVFTNQSGPAWSRFLTI